MTITPEFCCGAFFGDTEVYEAQGAGASVEYESTIKKTGAYSFKFYSSSSRYVNHYTSASRQKRTATFCRHGNLPTGTDKPRIMSLLGAADAYLVELRMTAGGVLSLVIGGVERDTYAGNLATDFFYHYGLDAKIDAAAGWAVVYLDGTEVLRYEGNTGDADVVKMSIGTSANGSQNLLWYHDDWYGDDTAGEGAAAAPPMKYFYEMALSASGNYSNFDGSDGNKVNNYQLVDEGAPNGDTDFVYAVAADIIDSYATTDYTIMPGLGVNAVHAYTIDRKTGVAATQIKPFLRENSTDWAGTAQNSASSYAMHIERRTTCPDDTAWDQTGITGLEVGSKSAGAYA